LNPLAGYSFVILRKKKWKDRHYVLLIKGKRIARSGKWESIMPSLGGLNKGGEKAGETLVLITLLKRREGGFSGEGRGGKEVV